VPLGLATALALLLAWVLVAPRTPDLAAAAYRVDLFEHVGMAVYDEHWYAGHALPGYSVLFGPLAWLLGLRVVGGLSVLASVACFERLTVGAYGPGPLRDAAAAAGVPFVPLRHVRRPVRPWRDLLGLVELIGLCRRIRPDIVHANSSKAGALAMLAGTVTGVEARVFTAHGWAFRWHAGFSARLYLWLERLTGRLATHVVCVSELSSGSRDSLAAAAVSTGVRVMARMSAASCPLRTVAMRSK